jgi:hypothetical protein
MFIFGGLIMNIMSGSPDGPTGTIRSLYVDNKYFSLLIALIISFSLIVGPFFAFADSVPSSFAPAFNNPVPVALVISIVITVLGFSWKRIHKEGRNVTIALSGVAALGIVTLAAFSAMLSDEFVDKESFDALRTSFAELDLNETQIARLEEILVQKGYATQTDLADMALTDVQRQQVQTLLVESGFVTEQDVIRIIEEENTRRLDGTCFLAPLPAYSSVAVRQSPRVEEGNLLRGLYPGEQLEVIGHNGGAIDNGRWWLVKYGNEETPTFGWVAGSVVAEINPGICTQLTQYPVN